MHETEKEKIPVFSWKFQYKVTFAQSHIFVSPLLSFALSITIPLCLVSRCVELVTIPSPQLVTILLTLVVVPFF